jgi:hypothetical protein
MYLRFSLSTGIGAGMICKRRKITKGTVEESEINERSNFQHLQYPCFVQERVPKATLPQDTAEKCTYRRLDVGADATDASAERPGREGPRELGPGKPLPIPLQVSRL